MKKTKFYLTSIIILTASSLYAQFILDARTVADAFFKRGEYYSAAEFYKKALTNTSVDSLLVQPYQPNRIKKQNTPIDESKEDHIWFSLAESYRLYNNHKLAEAAYKKVLGKEDPKFRLVSYWYGQSLLKNGEYLEALNQLRSFLDSYHDSDDVRKSAELAIASCKYAIEEIRFPRIVTVSKLGGKINTEGSNYSLIRTDNSNYFTSSRPSDKSVKGKTFYANSRKFSLNDNKFLNAIYRTDSLVSNSSLELQKLDIKGDFKEFGAPAISSDGKYLYFTGWGSQKNHSNYMIYRSEKINEDNWSEGVALPGPVNLQGYHSKQPALSADGKYLIFASDRPGGLGQYDIWFSELAPDGVPINVTNLGPRINSSGVEVSPHYNSNTTHLVFSSDGRVGMGGFDLYHSTGNFKGWTEPKNFGYPFNSAKDDLYYFPIKPDGNEAYISSDRSSECCLEIFSLSIGKIKVSGSVTDCNNQEIIKGAKVTFTDSVTNEENEVFSDENGMFEFYIDRRRPFRIASENQKYSAKTIEFPNQLVFPADSSINASLCMQPFKPDLPVVSKADLPVVLAVFYDFNTANITNPSKIVLDSLALILKENPGIKIELSAHTDNKGKALYNLELSQKRAQSCVDYLITKNIDPGRLQPKGYGSFQAVAPNTFPDGKDNPAGRQLNRRTEIKILKE